MEEDWGRNRAQTDADQVGHLLTPPPFTAHNTHAQAHFSFLCRSPLFLYLLPVTAAALAGIFSQSAPGLSRRGSSSSSPAIC